MKQFAFIVLVLLAAAPGHAAGKLKKFKKLLVCGVGGEQTARLGFEEKGAPTVNIADALDASAKALESELEAAGIGFIPLADAVAAAKARAEQAERESDATMDAHADVMGQAAGTGANTGVAAAMQAAMNNPALTPEQREQMRKAFAQSSGQAGSAMTAKAKAGNRELKGMGRDMAALAPKKGSPSTQRVLGLCPRDADEIYDDAGNKEAREFAGEVGADGWLFVNAAFGGGSKSGATAWQPTNAAAGVAKALKDRWIPQWSYEVKVYNAKGKRVWFNRKPIMSDEVKIGKTTGSAKKAIAASAPAGIKKLVAELAK